MRFLYMHCLREVARNLDCFFTSCSTQSLSSSTWQQQPAETILPLTQSPKKKIMPLRRNRHSSFRTDSLALLAAQAPLHVTQAYYLTWRRRHRYIELRANVLLLFRHTPEKDLTNAEEAIVLTSGQHHPCAMGSHKVRVDEHSFYFHSTRHATAFRAALLGVTERPPVHRYKILSNIGRGASGTVHAVKIINATPADHHGEDKKKQKGKQGIEDEQNDGGEGEEIEEIFAVKSIAKADVEQLVSGVDHLVTERLILQQAAETASPFIVGLVDAFETSRHFHLVTELAEYGNLHSILNCAPNNRLPERVARHLFAEVAAALSDTHANGFLYRDMKPGNVLITATGHTRLADFGLSKQVRLEMDPYSYLHHPHPHHRPHLHHHRHHHHHHHHNATPQLIGRARSFVGTRRYMAPEQIAVEIGGSSDYGAPADVWGLGLILYRMIVGEHPFTDEKASIDDDPKRLAWNIANSRVSIPPFVSPDAKDLLLSMLHREERSRVSLIQVMTHPWLSSIDWTALRNRALNDVVEKYVVDYFKKLDVPHVTSDIDEHAQEDNSFWAVLNRQFSIREEECFDSSSSSSRKMPRLLGFSYLP